MDALTASTPSFAALCTNTDSAQRPMGPDVSMVSSDVPGGAACRRRRHPITLNDCQRLFHLPVEDAARRLGVSRPTISRVMRAHGMRRWPFRSLTARAPRTRSVGVQKKTGDDALVRAASSTMSSVEKSCDSGAYAGSLTDRNGDSGKLQLVATFSSAECKKASQSCNPSPVLPPTRGSHGRRKEVLQSQKTNQSLKSFKYAEKEAVTSLISMAPLSIRNSIPKNSNRTLISKSPPSKVQLSTSIVSAQSISVSSSNSQFNALPGDKPSIDKLEAFVVDCGPLGDIRFRAVSGEAVLETLGRFGQSFRVDKMSRSGRYDIKIVVASHDCSCTFHTRASAVQSVTLEAESSKSGECLDHIIRFLASSGDTVVSASLTDCKFVPVFEQLREKYGSKFDIGD